MKNEIVNIRQRCNLTQLVPRPNWNGGLAVGSNIKTSTLNINVYCIVPPGWFEMDIFNRILYFQFSLLLYFTFSNLILWRFVSRYSYSAVDEFLRYISLNVTAVFILGDEIDIVIFRERCRP